MRTRMMAALLLAVSMVPLHSHAQTSITAFAVNQPGQAVAVSTARNTFVIKPTTASLPVKATVTCLFVERFKSGIQVSSRLVPLSGTQVHASVKAGGVTYYVMWQSFAQQGNPQRQVITVLGITKNIVPTNPCGSNPNLKNAAGIAIYG